MDIQTFMLCSFGVIFAAVVAFAVSVIYLMNSVIEFLKDVLGGK